MLRVMVSRPNHPRTAFGQRLAAELERQNVSARELARRMNPADPVLQRRSIARWLAPVGSAVNPSPLSRANAAAALGLDAEAFSEDDEEEAAQMPLTRDDFSLLGDLLSRLGPTLSVALGNEQVRA
jgi:transcriptional regulator with XRE-family HTH domain